jgi:Periplasmic copper-binding protein (NosD)
VDISGIIVDAGATNTVVANNIIGGSHGEGISNADATGTAITSNTVRDTCAAGIPVSGASAGVSVQNNVAMENGYPRAGCDPSLSHRADIAVYDGAVTEKGKCYGINP